jgi:hypothetical protein
MTTSAKELQAPYASVLAGIRDRSAGRLTLAEALILEEASHVATVRREMRTPHGGWKNDLPLEHISLLGFFIRGMRTGDLEHLRTIRSSTADAGRREIADTLLNAENVYVDAPECARMTTDQLIDYAANERYFA